MEPLVWFAPQAPRSCEGGGVPELPAGLRPNARSLPSQAQPPDPGVAHGAMSLLPGPAEPPGPEPPLGGSGSGGVGGARARHVIINVGGCRVRLAWAALARCPLARLERLRACRGHDELLRVCDDYDVSRDEFFFDRSPCAFRAIVALLRAGKLRLLRGACALAFRDELAYWGIDEARLERCCLRRLRRREEEAAEARAGPAERGGPRQPGLRPWGRRRAAGARPAAPARRAGRPALGPGRQALRLRVRGLRGRHGGRPLPQHHARHPRRGGEGERGAGATGPGRAGGGWDGTGEGRRQLGRGAPSGWWS